MEYSSVLKKIPLFSGVAEQEIGELMDCLTARKMRYKKHETICFPGDPVGEVGIICEGGVLIQGEDFMGNRSIISHFGVGELFGEAFACAKTDRIPVGIVSTADSVVIMIHYRKILTTCTPACCYHNRLIENMLGVLAGKNIELNQKIQMLSKRSTREKLIAYLSTQSHKSGSRRFTIPFDRQELADYLCVDRSAMSVELSKLRAEGLVASHRSDFELLGNSDAFE